LGWSADYNDAGSFLNTYRSDSVNNDSGYSNAKFDDLLNRAATETDANRRRELLEQAERLMLNESPILPLYYFATKRLVKPYVDGRIDNPLNRLYSKDFSLSPH
jgi:oligopeptide transport system substrate-binding protein